MTRNFQVSVIGGAIVLLSGVLGVAGFLPAPAAGASQAAGLGIWRLMGGSLIIVGAFLQSRGNKAGGALALLLGLFEFLVISQERDLLQGDYVALLSGASLAVIGGVWALSKRRS